MMLERFGFKRSCPAVLAPSTSRHKTATKNKSTNAVLMNRTKEERERLITEKVAIILIGEEGTPPSATADIPQNNQPAEGIVETNKNLQKYEDKSHSLWNMGSVSLSEKGFLSHYVKELSKIISPSKVPAGAKLKHLSQIPGRSKTPEKTSHILLTEGDTCSLVSRGTLVQTKTDDRKETEAAEEIRPKARQSSVDRLTDESPGKNSFTEMLISDWKSLLNKKAMSDLTIYVERDEEIPGHRLVFYVRCRAILKDIVSEVSADATKKTSDMLLWVDVSYTAALAFLEFLYCGLASEILRLDEDDLSNVKRLAQRYRFTELLQYLQVVNNVRSRVNESTYFSASSLPQVLTPHHSVSRRRKQNSLHPSNQCTGFLAISSPKKQMYSEDTFSSHKLSTELTEKSVCSVSSKTRDISNEFHDSAESKLCSNARLSPDLFRDDEGECVETSQENRSSMDYLLSMIGKSSLSQSHSQTNFTEISSDKPTCPNTSSVDPSTSHLKNDSLCVTAISDEVSTQNDTRISYSSQSHDKKSTSPDKDLICIEHHDDIQDKCDFLTATLVPRSHATPESVSTISPVKTGAQRNLSGINYENHRQSSQPKEVHNECIRFENPQEDTADVESASDGIDFLEHLLLDSHSNYMQGDIKGRVESKRKHKESDTVSDHCSSLTKKLCSDGSEHENVETFFDTTELQEQSDKFRTLEDNVTEIIDLTQDSIDSESPLTPPIRASIVSTDMETEHNSPSVTKEYSKITVWNDLFKKSDDSSTRDQTTKSVHLDSDSKSGVEENTTSVEELDNWDRFDEMCNAPLPQIFSQCLTQMISTQPTSKKSLKSSTSSNKCRISQNSGSRSLRLSPSLPKYSVQETPNYSSSCSSSPVRKPENVSEKINEVPSREQESLKGKDVLDNLNKSVFWRDENEPTLRIAPKQTAHSDHSNIAEHRTPTRKQMHVKFSDRVTPSADYSAMKTPQLKKELKKYGLKPSLSKRHAKIMLRYIYDQLHPYVSVSDSEVDVQESEVELSPFKKPGSDTQVPRSPVWKDNNLGTSGSSARKNIMRTEVVSHEGCPVTQRRNYASQSDTGSDSDDLLLSQESSSSSAQSVAEEAFCEELDDLSQGNVSSSQDACSSADLATVVHNFITSDPDLHQKVLLYEPIWIEKLHADLKANNFKFKTNQLMEYLDEQCITFRTAQGQRNRQRKNLMKGAKRRKLTKRKKDSSDV
ncbi:structure-specific endonuclease subunit SLX4-like isoform X2 [Zootermopsis nevadensis]|nr:structure-specific endonuclease subunit SLX4-like isoform X2 [Zootermopsis nevadensis]